MSRKTDAARAEMNRYERSWALFEQREHVRDMEHKYAAWLNSLIADYNRLSAAGRLQLRAEHPSVYRWLQRHA